MSLNPLIGDFINTIGQTRSSDDVRGDDRFDLVSGLGRITS
jgi:hypothetical protein